MIDWIAVKKSSERPVLYLGTSNPRKIEEMTALLDSLGVDARELKDIPDVEENARSYKGNALLKARAAAGQNALPVISEDSGLGVRALNGAPGLRSGRYSGSADHNSLDNAEKLLRVMKNMADRRAGFVTAAAYSDGTNEMSVTRRTSGTIADRQRGDKGFSYDTVFIPEGSDETYAESGDKSNSSRDKAVRALVHRLREKGLL